MSRKTSKHFGKVLSTRYSNRSESKVRLEVPLASNECHDKFITVNIS